jgi:ADP-ribosylglycohydrolase
MISRIDRIKGSLIGGAVGDALGYPVEFLSELTLFTRYGDTGITEYKLNDGVAVVSDDTQMTLFTLEGLLHAKKRYTSPTVDEYTKEIYESYKDWLRTQNEYYDPNVRSDRSELLNVERLYYCRAPGNTCLGALESGECGDFEKRINRSKGCGGVMRIAPIPLMLAGSDVPLTTADMIAARSAAITHSHDLGFIPAAFLSHMIGELMQGAELLGAAKRALAATDEAFAGSEELPTLDRLIKRAIQLSAMDEIPAIDAIGVLGEGWVAEEAVAIAVYCALKFGDDFTSAIIASVNHKGDSDSTGAITGNILGAYLGIDAIPEQFLENLEFKDMILELAERVSNA